MVAMLVVVLFQRMRYLFWHTNYKDESIRLHFTALHALFRGESVAIV